VKHNIIKHYN